MTETTHEQRVRLRHLFGIASTDVPCPLTGSYIADRIWFVDAYHYLTSVKKESPFNYVAITPQMDGRYLVCADAYVGEYIKTFEIVGDSMTAAILLAAQAAGVPEIVEILGKVEHGH